jgi:hypothetical protein
VQWTGRTSSSEEVRFSSVLSASSYLVLEFSSSITGSVLSLLTGKQNDASYRDSDFDLFLYGLKHDEVCSGRVSRLSDAGLTIFLFCALAAHPQSRLHRRADQGGPSSYPEGDQEPLQLRNEGLRDYRGCGGRRGLHDGPLLRLGRAAQGGVNDSQRCVFLPSLSCPHPSFVGSPALHTGFNAITLVPPRTSAHTGSSRRVIQIVLVSNPSIFDALAPFDLDACCVGYTGKQVVALPRAVRALSFGEWKGGVNFLDIKLARKLGS